MEIGGPEDGFSLLDPSKFASARTLGARSIDLRPIWSTLEPQPGVYDWTSLDGALHNAAAVGLPVTITLRFFDHQVPEWLVDENMIDQDGRNHFAYSGFESRSPSYWGPRARSSYLRLIDALVRRYRDNASVLAWQVFYGYNDSFYLGMWRGEQTIYDYSQYSQEMYRHYLSGVRQFSLAALNRRYGTSYRAWNEVRQPRPAFESLNVSLAWHDFQDYRMWSIERMFADMYRTVRQLDARPLILYYGGSLHHAAHQLSVYDVGLRLLRHYGGALDITCFEDPVPAEIGSGIVHRYGIPLMAEAWQVPPPRRDFRRMFFHIFALGVDAFQLVGSWEKMEPSPDEFIRVRAVFQELAAAKPVRAPVAGLFSYRSILSHIPARNYINPTLAMIPTLQEHQYSLDWYSDFTPLDSLQRYPALLDANSEVLSRQVIDTLVQYVARGGKLVLLPRSGRYTLEDGQSDWPLLERLQRPAGENARLERWVFGNGSVTRVTKDLDWCSEAGAQLLIQLMEWLGVERPITASAGVLAAVSRSAQGTLYVTMHWPKDRPGSASFGLRQDLVEDGHRYRVTALLGGNLEQSMLDPETLTKAVPVAFTPYELKVLRLSPE
ncbi:MAG: hypothetical protein A2W31_15905 [Planctomycetes bacterium RBG_16_64_10]|nr:MAG: hypothetical protein A2W31_15905 [Planctomycetes bacterium RBG_16_64_10]